MEHKRHFVKDDFRAASWSEVLPYFESLLEDDPQNLHQTEAWISRRDELDNVLSEELAWRYIRMTCDTLDPEKEKAYLHFVNEIQPSLAAYSDKLNKKVLSMPALPELEASSQAFQIYFRHLKKSAEMFREANIPLQTALQNLSQKYSAIQGGMTIFFEGKELTLQQAAVHLKSLDRNKRKQIFELIIACRQQHTGELERLFDEMLGLRHQMALNAGYANFRDYMFDALGRFDYSPSDCFNFHEAIEKVIVPLNRQLMEERRMKLGIEVLKPYDTEVDPSGSEPLKPFEGGEALLEKGIQTLAQVHPYVSQCLQTMKEMGHLDLESRKGKAPGGYNYPLMESGVPFIFMNAAGTLRDVETLVHEAGHALHSFLANEISLGIFKNTSAEVAELASMSMELLSMKGWQSFFEDPEDLNRAKREQLEGILSTLPWIATVDAFQHWIYTNPGHSAEERAQEWLRLGKRFGTGLIDWSEYREAEPYTWHRQLHIFELPFYYVEYGFAQLGAIGVWKNSLNDESKAIRDYMDALRLGNTLSIPELYNRAGVRFAFDEEYVASLMNTVWTHRNVLNAPHS